jgi:hypothetical protein
MQASAYKKPLLSQNTTILLGGAGNRCATREMYWIFKTFCHSTTELMNLDHKIANVAADAKSAFNQLVKDCNQSPSCRAAFPKLSGHLDALLDRLEAKPEPIHFTHPMTGERLEDYLEATKAY